MRRSFGLMLCVFAALTTRAATVTVEVHSFFFSPREVTIQPGDKITWLFIDAGHTTTSDTHVWDSGFRAPMATFDVVFANAGTFPYYCLPHGGPNGVGMSGVITVKAGTPAPPVPSFILATATSTSAVALNWGTSANATSYDVFRSSMHSPFAFAFNTPNTSALDNGLAPDTTYLYEVRAIGTGGVSAFTMIDAATTTAFTDGALFGVQIKAVHVAEARTAVNAMRRAAGLAPVTFSDLSTGDTILATHITELRSALDAARATILLPMIGYTDSITPGTTLIKAVHVEELRAGTQ